MTSLAASITLPLSVAAATLCFRGIVLRYRTLYGFPWLLSAGFGAAAIVAILALHALLDP